MLYARANGLVAHECIIEMRHLKKSAGVEVDDVAKRLMDYGFHAPTMSFPVAGTLMIEPTESESKAELDRFCDAMIAIRAEIAAIEEGRADPADNPLKNAPHTMDDHRRARVGPRLQPGRGGLPGGRPQAGQVLAPVNRIDQVHGDRNLICACPPWRATRRPLSSNRSHDTGENSKLSVVLTQLLRWFDCIFDPERLKVRADRINQPVHCIGHATVGLLSSSLQDRHIRPVRPPLFYKHVFPPSRSQLSGPLKAASIWSSVSRDDRRCEGSRAPYLCLDQCKTLQQTPSL